MTSHHKTHLNLPNLDPAALEAYIFPAMENLSLLSVGQLCDAGCKALFDEDQVHIITKLGTILLTGFRDPTTRLWLTPISTQTTPIPLANIVNFSTKAKDIVAFLHAAFYSPALSTLRQALMRNFITIPGLTLKTLAA